MLRCIPHSRGSDSCVDQQQCGSGYLVDIETTKKKKNETAQSTMGHDSPRGIDNCCSNTESGVGVERYVPAFLPEIKSHVMHGICNGLLNRTI